MSGLVLIMDKEEGPTSFDVVRQVKKVFPGQKVGHAGSLDPFATGVLVVLLGKATKLSGSLLNADKTYRATVLLGQSTDSMDKTGKVVESRDIPSLSQTEVEAALQSFEGEWLQTPPMFSAKKQNGVRLYELARKNIEVKREPIKVQLFSLRLLEWAAPRLTFEVHCSKGTYIRALADELARRLGTVGHLEELRRLSCGGFTLDEGVKLNGLANELDLHRQKGYRNYVRLLSREGVRNPRHGHLPI